MKKKFFHQGQTLMEVLLALAVFLLLVSGGTVLSVRYLETLQRALDIRQVVLIAGEGLEALENISAGEWTTIQNSNENTDYGLVQNGGVWQLQLGSDVTDNKFTRSLRIAPVYRDVSCQITQTPGTLDPDTKRISLTLSWSIGEKTFSRVFEKYFTNWRTPSDLCTVTQAGSLIINVDSATLDTQQKQINGIVLENEGLTDITIDKMIVSWIEQSNGEVRIITIGGTNRWHASSAGDWSPSGEQPTGTELNIANVTIPHGTSISMDKVRFNSKLDGSIFTITAIMTDTSSTAKSKDFTP